MARNDEYMGNAKWRLETTINFLALELKKLNKLELTEIIIVDWQSKIPLFSILDLNEHARKIVRFIVVPFSLSEKVKFDDDFPRSIIMNAGIRRSKGLFIIQTLGDVLWTQNTLHTIFNIIDNRMEIKTPIERTLFVFGRKEIPYEVVRSSPNISFLKDYIKIKGDNLKFYIRPYLLVPADSIMMHRDLWFDCRAFDETLQHWGWSDCDLILRLRLRHFILSIHDEKELFVYHLNHISEKDIIQINTRKTNPQVINPFVVNDENWGLIKYQFEEFPPKTTFTDLAYSATISQIINDNYLRKHLINLAKFVLNNITYENVIFAMHFTMLILSHYPKGSIPQKLYYYLIRIKQLIKPALSEQ